MRRYVYYSPDGFPTSPETFLTREEAEADLESWLKRYEPQGYYARMNGERIPLTALKAACSLQTATPFLYELPEHMRIQDQALVVTDGDRNLIGVITIRAGQEDSFIETLDRLLSSHFDADILVSGGDFYLDERTGVFTGDVSYDMDGETCTYDVLIHLTAWEN